MSAHVSTSPLVRSLQASSDTDGELVLVRLTLGGTFRSDPLCVGDERPADVVPALLGDFTQLENELAAEIARTSNVMAKAELDMSRRAIERISAAINYRDGGRPLTGADLRRKITAALVVLTAGLRGLEG